MIIRIKFNTDYLSTIDKILQNKRLAKSLRNILEDIVDSANYELTYRNNEDCTIGDVLKTFDDDQLLALEALVGFVLKQNDPKE